MNNIDRLNELFIEHTHCEKCALKGIVEVFKNAAKRRNAETPQEMTTTTQNERTLAKEVKLWRIKDALTKRSKTACYFGT